MSRSYTSSPPCVSIGVLWDCFTFIYTVFTTQLLVACICLYKYVQMHMYTLLCIWTQQTSFTLGREYTENLKLVCLYPVVVRHGFI
jgi:hypothetical protein